MNSFRPTLVKLAIPIVVLGLSVIPIQALRQLLFGLLAWPLRDFVSRPPFAYQDKGFLTPLGALAVGVVWAVTLYFVISLLSWIFAKRH
jgi:hypothetical protein